MDPNILQSLQEIASLLLMIHDIYLKDVVGSDILVALVTLLRDAKLNNCVSVLDAEKLRRAVMRNGESHLGYELFYEWLRDVGQLVFKDGDIGGKKALQQLLTLYILPFAASMDNYRHPNHSVNLPYYTESALGVMIDNADFLYSWFFHIANLERTTFAHHNDSFLLCKKSNTASSCKAVDGLRLNTDNLITALHTCGLVETVEDGRRQNPSSEACAITDNDLESILLLVGGGMSDQWDGDGAVEEDQRDANSSVDFPSFLYLLELISERTSFSSKALEVSRDHRLLVLLKAAAGEMLRNVARGMVDADRIKVIEGGGGDEEGEESCDALRPPAVLRWLRQSAVVCLDLADVPWIYQQLTIYADYDCTAGDPHVWRVDRLPFVFSRMLEKIGAVLGCTFRSNGEREGGHLVGLMRILPRLFFYEDGSFPSGGLPLFASLPATVTSWREVVERGFTLFFEKAPSLLVADNASSVSWIERLNNSQTVGSTASSRICRCHCVDIRELIRFFTSLPRLHQVVPQLVDELLLLDICSSVLGSSSGDDADSIVIPRNCLLEVMFVLVFNYWGVIEPALCVEMGEAPLEEDELTGDHHVDETQYCVRVFELLSRLVHFVLTCVDQSIATTQTDTFAKLSSSTDVETDPAHFVGSSPRQSSEEAARTEQQHPMRDVAVLLTHYPLASFELCPWDVAQLCSLGDYGAPSESTDSSYSPAHHPESSLTDLLRSFSSKFSVSIGDLSQFFAEYYTDSDDASHVELKRASLQCSTMSLFMESRTLRLLHLNNDLLKWEFGRCLARFRSASDPFTEGVLVPFAVDSERNSEGNSSSQSTLLVSHAAALSWASAHGFDRDVAQLHLDAISYLAGQSLLSGGYLTFSTFLVFAVRCFAREVEEGISSREECEDRFVDHIRGMLHVFSQNLSSVQQSMQVRVLRLLFAPLGDAQGSSDSHSEEERDCAPVLQASLALFNRLIFSSVDASASSLLPPRPPAALWDPPRFVCFCKHLGILSGYEFSVEMAWVAYGLCLRELSPRTSQVWDTDRIVPPVPVLIGETQALDKLCRCLLLMASSVEKSGDGDRSPGALPAFSMNELCFKTVTPVVCMSVDMLGNGEAWSVPRQHWVGGEYPLLEDVLRYGGSEAVGSLSSCQDFLLLSFCGLCEQSKSLLSSPFSNVPQESFVCEASINLVCKFFASCLVLRMGTIAVQAKRSLQPRLRPIYHNRKGQGPVRTSAAAEAVTMCFAEFEELFLRCAFALWESSGALSHKSHTPSEEALLRSGAASAQTETVSLAARQYVDECRQQQAARKLTAGRKSNNRRDVWGIDFISPFAAVLRSHTNTTGSLALLDESVLDSRRLRCSSFLDSSYVLEGAPQSIATVVNTPREGAALLDILSNSRLKYSIADPVARTRDDSRLSPDLKRKALTEDSPKQPLHTSQQVITSSSERVQLLQESSEQFVVALDSLLVGSKEALWPVYATYCSCGDSSDPGKLSGPNLFTLLSKLGVLTDRTVLSDIGVLLHQISTHSFCTSVAGSTVATLIDSSRGSKTPALTFEEFLVFLCAFSRLRFEGLLFTPHDMTVDAAGNSENWFRQWQQFMGSSRSFRRLLSECILPVLKKRTLLAFPEDARLRDRFTCVFSVEVLTAIEGAEGPLQQFFQRERGESSRSISENSVGIAGIVAAMKRIRLVPNVVQESQVLQLIEDVLPERRVQRSKVLVETQVEEHLLFPQWEWVLSVVACQAVETAIQQSAAFSTSEKIPMLVADVVTSIANAMAAERK